MVGLTAPVVHSWTLTDMVVALAKAGNLATLIVGCWTLMRLVVVSYTQMYQMFAEAGCGSLKGFVVVLMGCWTLMGLMASNVNLDATVSAAPRHCGLT